MRFDGFAINPPCRQPVHAASRPTRDLAVRIKQVGRAAAAWESPLPRRTIPGVVPTPGLSGSGGSEIDRGLLAATIRFDFIAQTLVLVQRGHAGLLNSADMHEAVIAAIFGRDETITFVCIEELDGADSHKCFLFTKTENPSAKLQMELVVCERKKIRIYRSQILSQTTLAVNPIGQ
jgi:hypothetical protein